MKNFKIISLFAFLTIGVVHAQGLEVSATQRVCDGPFVNTGDLSRLKIATEKALIILEDECFRKNPHGFSMLKGLEKVIRLDTDYETLHCLEIEITDQCFIR